MPKTSKQCTTMVKAGHRCLRKAVDGKHCLIHGPSYREDTLAEVASRHATLAEENGKLRKLVKQIAHGKVPNPAAACLKLLQQLNNDGG